MAPKLLITGATGNIGSLVVKQLLQMGHVPRIFVRNQQKAEALFGQQVEVCIGDMEDESRLGLAMSGIEGVLLINSGERIGIRDKLAVAAARTAGIKRIVKLSSLDERQTGGVGTIGAWHQQGEDAIRESGIPFTIVQSVAFMTNTLGWAKSISQRGTVSASTGNGKIAMIDPEDIATVLVLKLLDEGNNSEILQATGPTLYSYPEMVEIVSKAIGRRIVYENITDDQACSNLVRIGMDPRMAEALVQVWARVREGRTAVLSPLDDHLGRPSRSFEEWVQSHVSVFTPKGTVDEDKSTAHSSV